MFNILVSEPGDQGHRQVNMVDLTTSAMEKLGDYNYRDWKTCINSYLRGQDLWDVVDGTETSPSPKENAQAYKKWDIKARKALFAIKTTIYKSLLAHIEDMDTPNEAWDALAMLYTKKNELDYNFLKENL